MKILQTPIKFRQNKTEKDLTIDTVGNREKQRGNSFSSQPFFTQSQASEAKNTQSRHRHCVDFRALHLSFQKMMQHKSLAWRTTQILSDIVCVVSSLLYSIFMPNRLRNGSRSSGKAQQEFTISFIIITHYDKRDIVLDLFIIATAWTSIIAGVAQNRDNFRLNSASS